MLAFRVFEQNAANFNGRIPSMLQEGGFDSVSEAERVINIFGPIWFYEARKQEVGRLQVDRGVKRKA